MEFATKLQRWWQRVRGEGQPTVRPARPAVGESAPAGARTATRIVGPGDAGELNLSVEGTPTTAAHAGKKPRRPSAGFDPYSNSAGHAKPRGWDSVSRK